MRKTALVKLSGDLINRADVLAWLRELATAYYVVVVCGGGLQINEQFEARGFGKNYTTLGRETRSFDERQLARDILEKNQAEIQDLLAREGIPAVVLIPVLDIGSVLCHVNGDIFVLTAYLGYDKLFILTLESRIGSKNQQLRNIWAAFDGGKYNEDFPPKINVVGFSDKP